METQHGVEGAANAVVSELTDNQVIEVNKFRLCFGTALYALEVEPELQENIKQAFRDNLKSELEKHQETLIQFLTAFAMEHPFDDIVSKYEKARRYAFPEFLFAGTIPIGYDSK